MLMFGHHGHTGTVHRVVLLKKRGHSLEKTIYIKDYLDNF